MESDNIHFEIVGRVQRGSSYIKGIGTSFADFNFTVKELEDRDLDRLDKVTYEAIKDFKRAIKLLEEIRERINDCDTQTRMEKEAK